MGRTERDGIMPTHGSAAVNAVESLIDDAWEMLDRERPRDAAGRARRALGFYPEAVDAYVVLAAATAVPAEAIALLREGRRTAERLARSDQRPDRDGRGHHNLLE